ncbi:cytosolic endo-beta-N-acetylglucosaminidase-like [Argonauta hians]
MTARAYEECLPICSPLKTIQQLINWTTQSDTLCASKQPLIARCSKPNQPRTIVCHDMLSGFLEDKYLQSIKKKNGYRFFSWQYVDMFIYFSHHFVTIPPAGWVSSAHYNGVLILGTVITEHDVGAKICNEILQSQESYELIARKLTEIAKFYNLDGWLLNIENTIRPDKIRKLVEFVKYLTERMTDEIPHSKVIWYDSVTKDGFLLWQNELNSENEIFFDSCHGIFLNYCWNDKNLQKSKEKCMAKSRPFDVYVGIDVFGRGCYAGGGYSSNVALKIIRSRELSAAIFANGWVYECQPPEDFLQNEIKFWSLLHPLCFVKPINNNFLSTSFCHGFGYKYFLNGKCLSQNEWISMGMQQLQPIQITPHAEISSQIYHEDAYLGGGCLKLLKENPGHAPPFCSIFHCNLPVKGQLFVTFCTKLPPVPAQTQMVPKIEMLQLTFTDPAFNRTKVILTSSSDYLPPELDNHRFKKKYKPALNGFIPTKSNNDWIKHCFLVEPPLPCTLTDVSAGILYKGNEPFNYLIGQIQILHFNDILRRSQCITNLQSEYLPEDNKIMVDWEFSDMSLVRYFNLYLTIGEGPYTFVAQSICCKCVFPYITDETMCLWKEADIKVSVQAVMSDCAVLPVEDCPSILVNL